MPRRRAQPRRRGHYPGHQARGRGAPVAALTGGGRLGRPRLHLRETDSTNERAKALALGGAPYGTLVTAGAQTAGRGRLGRAWVAPPGSAVLASVVLRGLSEDSALLPLAAAVAVCEACERCSPVTCAIKWPNDVWIEGRKVAGILVEGRPQEGWVVLGIGLNVKTRTEDLPDELHATATSLAIEAGAAPGVESVLAALLAALEAACDWSPGEVIAAWRTRDALRGRAIRWDTGEGIAEGIDRSGSLLVATNGGRRIKLQTGDVGLVRPSGGET